MILLKDACKELAEMTAQRSDGLVTFARRHYADGSPQPLSDLETKLLDNGIIRFARQEFGSRTYHVVDKALRSVVEVNT